MVSIYRALAYGPGAAALVLGTSTTFFGIPWSEWHDTYFGIWNVIRIGPPGFSFLFYGYSLLMLGAYALVLVWRYGYRGLFLTVIVGFTCEIAIIFLGDVNTPLAVFTNAHGLEPIVWAVVLPVCYLVCSPFKLNLLSWWTVGMLLSWLAAFHYADYFGAFAFRFTEPTFIVSWLVAAYKGVRLG